MRKKGAGHEHVNQFPKIQIEHVLRKTKLILAEQPYNMTIVKAYTREMWRGLVNVDSFGYSKTSPDDHNDNWRYPVEN